MVHPLPKYVLNPSTIMFLSETFPTISLVTQRISYVEVMPPGSISTNLPLPGSQNYCHFMKYVLVYGTSYINTWCSTSSILYSMLKPFQMFVKQPKQRSYTKVIPPRIRHNNLPLRGS